MTEWHEDIGRWEEAPDVGSIEWQGSFEPVPSPGWWASDSRLVSGRSTELGNVVLKQISRHAWSWRNRHNLIAASAAAGEAGIGPRVFASDAELGVLLMEQLPPDEWRVGRLVMFTDPEVRRSIGEARRRFAELDVSLSTRSPLIDLNQLVDECQDRGFSIDHRVADLISYVNTFREALLAYRSTLTMRPSQGEGTSSNIMVGRDGQVKLLGWGSAARLSAVHDHALLLAEATPGALDLDEYMAELAPDASPTDRAVMKLVTGIEHLRWAVLTRLRALADPDENLDSTKYGMWRMTFAEMLLNQPEIRAELEAELS